MAINPLLVSIKQASDLPSAIPTNAGEFLFFEDDTLKKAEMSNIYDRLESSYLGIASTSTTPPTTGSWWYDATEVGTYTNFIKADTNPIVLTATDFEDAGVFYDVKIVVSEDVAQVGKRERLMPSTDIITTEVLGQSEIPYALEASASYMFVRNEAVGINGTLQRIDFAQPIDYAVSPKFAVLEKVGSAMKIVDVYTVSTTIGQSFIDVSPLNITITEDQYIGLQVLGYIYKCQVEGSVQSYLFEAAEIVVDGESTNVLPNDLVYDYSLDVDVVTPLSVKIEEIETQIAGIGFKPFAGLTIDTNGDSITWYDGHAYESVHSETPAIAQGYQSYLRNTLGAITNNNGISGATLPQIRTALVARNYAAIPYVTITGGVNDWAVGTPIGSIQPQSATFNTATSYGAVQSIIEHILGQNPEARMFLITPIRGRIDALGEFPETYADMFKAIGKLYGIPVCDWYNNLSFNTLNYDEYYKDIGVLADRKIHVGNAGYKRMGEYLAGWLLSNI